MTGYTLPWRHRLPILIGIADLLWSISALRPSPASNAAAEKTLPPGSFYTEPGGVAHFAETKADPVVIYITGHGPTDTVFVK